MEVLKELNLNEKALCYAVFTETEEMSRLAREVEFKKECISEFAANRKLMNLIKNAEEGFILNNILVICAAIKNLESSFELNESVLDEVLDELGLRDSKIPFKNRQERIFQLLKFETKKEEEIKEMLKELIEEDFIEEDLDQLDEYVDYYYFAFINRLLFERERIVNFEAIRDNPTKLIVKLDNEMYRNLEIIRMMYSNSMVTPGNTDVIKYLLKNQILELEKEHESLLITVRKLVDERIGKNE